MVAAAQNGRTPTVPSLRAEPVAVDAIKLDGSLDESASINARAASLGTGSANRFEATDPAATPTHPAL